MTGISKFLNTKNTGALTQQTQTEAQETLEVKLKELRESFFYDVHLQLEKWIDIETK